MSRVLVVVPAHDEAEHVGHVITGVRAALPDAGVVVVDDGSTDDTASVAAAAGATVLRHRHNLGVGAAVRTGLRHARDAGHDVVLRLDGDGQHVAAAAPSLLLALADADLVVGSRFTAGQDRVPAHHRFAMAVLRGLLRWSCGLDVPDPTSGMRAHGPRAVRALADDQPLGYLEDTVLALDVVVRAGLRVTWLPVPMTDSPTTRSPLRTLVDAWRTITVAARLVARGVARRARPSRAQ